jgi:hypothetical protein
MRSEIGLGVLALAGAAVVVALVKRPVTPDGIAARTRARLAVAGGAGIVLVGAALASRPLWLEQHAKRDSTYLANLQSARGIGVEPGRSYGERSVSWLAWYFGWPTIVLGLLGVALITWVAVRRRWEWAGPVAVVLVYAALFLWRPSVVPVQIWAMRRYLTIVIPGVLVGAAFALAKLSRRGRAAAVVSAVLAAVCVALPAVVLAPVFRVRDNTPALEQARVLCDAVGDDAAVIMLDPTANLTSRTLAGMCGAVVARARSPLDQAALAAAQASAAEQGLNLFVIASRPDEIPYRAAPGAPATRFSFTAWRPEILRAPDAERRWGATYWVGRIGRDGRADPVAA